MLRSPMIWRRHTSCVRVLTIARWPAAPELHTQVGAQSPDQAIRAAGTRGERRLPAWQALRGTRGRILSTDICLIRPPASSMATCGTHKAKLAIATLVSGYAHERLCLLAGKLRASTPQAGTPCEEWIEETEDPQARERLSLDSHARCTWHTVATRRAPCQRRQRAKRARHQPPSPIASVPLLASPGAQTTGCWRSARRSCS